MKTKRSQVRSLLDMLVTFIVVCVLFVSLRYFIRFPIVSGESMQPTYQNNDRLAVLYTKDLGVNDIAIVWSQNLDEYIVKRVVGIPGDTIVIKDNALYRNEARLLEFYIQDENWESQDMAVTLQEDQYFVLGDNRNNSTDSRAFGVVLRSDIFGKVLFRMQKGENHERSRNALF